MSVYLLLNITVCMHKKFIMKFRAFREIVVMQLFSVPNKKEKG